MCDTMKMHDDPLIRRADRAIRECLMVTEEARLNRQKAKMSAP